MTDDKTHGLSETEPEQESRAPFLKIINGSATPEEVAAIVAVLAAVGSAATEPAARRTPEWSAHHRRTRATFPHGPSGWRSSALPR